MNNILFKKLIMGRLKKVWSFRYDIETCLSKKYIVLSVFKVKISNSPGLV